MSKSSSALSRIDAFADRSSVRKYRHRGADDGTKFYAHADCEPSSNISSDSLSLFNYVADIQVFELNVFSTLTLCGGYKKNVNKA